MIKYQGDDIAFSIEMFTDETESVPINLALKDDVFIYAYTDGCIVDKFSKTEQVGYKPLVASTDFEYAGVIDSEITKIMAEGQMIFEVNIVTGSINEVKVFSSGINLVKSKIKAES